MAPSQPEFQEDAWSEEDEETDESEGRRETGPEERAAPPDVAGQRLDVFLTAAFPALSRAEAQRLLAAGRARVDGKPAKANYRLRGGEHIGLTRPEPVVAQALPEAIPLHVLYEDSDVLVIDKPRGMVVHPAPGAASGTLVNAVLAHADDLSGIGGELRPGIVHRLDKDTGGLIMVAKNDTAHRSLQAQIQARAAKRRYLALVWGVPRFTNATVDAPIGRHPTDRKRMAVLTDPRFTSRPALTELHARETFAATFALLEARLQTGRTHQIRVHCAYIQHPIVGDPVYGGIRKLPASLASPQRRQEIEQAIAALNGQALHAFALSFDHPRTGERLEFTVPLPPPMQALLDLLRALP